MADTHYNRDLVVANILFGANFSFYVSLTGGGMDFRLIFLCQILVGVVVFVPAAAVTRAFYRLTLRDAAVMALVTLHSLSSRPSSCATAVSSGPTSQASSSP